MSLQTTKLGDEDLPFSMFYKDTHWSKKKNDYIHPKCRQNYDEIARHETETVESGDPRYMPEQLSQMVLGERSGYLLGFGKGPKLSSATKSSAFSKATFEEIEKLKAKIDEQNTLIISQNERMQKYEENRIKYEEDSKAKEIETQKQFEQIFRMMRDKFGGDGTGGHINLIWC